MGVGGCMWVNVGEWICEKVIFFIFENKFRFFFFGDVFLSYLYFTSKALFSITFQLKYMCIQNSKFL